MALYPKQKVEYFTPRHTPLSAKKSDGINKFTISMLPMQIRTFIVLNGNKMILELR
ncbi:hypothetical protein DOY81_010063, partial [Sarcophaga bullata]